MITSVTRHQQRFSMRNTKVNGRNNAASIMQSMIGAAWRLPERSPEIGVAMRRELIVNACLHVFIEYPKINIYSPETFYFYLSWTLTTLIVSGLNSIFRI
jgi:hypothetical protein